MLNSQYKMSEKSNGVYRVTCDSVICGEIRRITENSDILYVPYTATTQMEPTSTLDDAFLAVVATHMTEKKRILDSLLMFFGNEATLHKKFNPTI